MTNIAPTPEALARLPRALAFRHDALPLSLIDGVLAVGLADPTDAVVVDVLRAATRLQVRPLPMAREAIREALRTAYAPRTASNAPSETAAEVPAVRAVDRIFSRAIAAHASDIHIDPGPHGGRVRLRVDGLLQDVEAIPGELYPSLTSRVKVLAGMDVADRRQPQDGRCGIPFERREIDARVASLPTIGGEKLVIRLLDGSANATELATLGMPHPMLEHYRAAIHAPWGFVLIAGPTGSGKTTTLYASLSELDARSRNVCSVEDPVERRLSGVAQVQVNVRAGLTFPIALRAFMRSDPNVVMVGELRDAATADVSVSAALSGQLVFTSLHATDAPRTIDRLVELGVARHSLAAALTVVVAQRLVRKLCEQCRHRVRIPPSAQDLLSTAQETWYVAAGCRACDGTGYVGRTGVYELLRVDDAIRDAIAMGVSSVHIAALAGQNGYRPMRQDARTKVLTGLTTFEEISRVVSWPSP
jgi:type IV pilus assembly protein PilB